MKVGGLDGMKVGGLDGMKVGRLDGMKVGGLEGMKVSGGVPEKKTSVAITSTGHDNKHSKESC